jgi:hypothetical protein
MSYDGKTVESTIPCVVLPYLQEIEKQLTAILGTSLLKDLIQMIVQYTKIITCQFTILEPADMHNFRSINMQGKVDHYDELITFTWYGEWLKGTITQLTRKSTCVELETIIRANIHWIGRSNIPFEEYFGIYNCESMMDDKVTERIQKALLLPTAPASMQTTIEWNQVFDILVANYHLFFSNVFCL